MFHPRGHCCQLNLADTKTYARRRTDVVNLLQCQQNDVSNEANPRAEAVKTHLGFPGAAQPSQRSQRNVYRSHLVGWHKTIYGNPRTQRQEEKNS